METWHDDVQCFAVRSGEGEDLATFFLDVSQPTSLLGAVECSPPCVPESTETISFWLPSVCLAVSHPRVCGNH